MESGKDIRWRQRFVNFEKAYKQFMEAIDNFSNLSTLEKEGLIQRFEYTFELSWKLMKDYFESKGENITSNTVIRLSSILNQELPLPYLFDIIHYESLQNEELRKQIDNIGVLIYSRVD